MALPLNRCPPPEAGAGERLKPIVWWNKRSYKEEDEGMQKIAADFARESNGEAEITFTTQDDRGPKIISALTSRRAPDVAFRFFTDRQIAPKFAWDGRFADVSDLVNELRPRYLESHLKTRRPFNKTENKWSCYSVPIEAQALGSHHRKDLVKEVGLDSDPKKIPIARKEHWALWKKVRDTLRKEDPAKYAKLYGIGMTSSSRATDTFYNCEQYLLAFHGEVLSPDGKVVAGEAKNREATVKTQAFFTSIYKEGSVPPDALTWTDADNNVNFGNKTVVMTPNPSVSIPAAQFFSNKDNYYNKPGGVWMLNGQWGIVNKILNDLGFAGYPWLVRRHTAIGAVIVYPIWKYLPFWTLIFVAGRRSIPKEPYEAGVIDGTSSLQKFRYITAPMLRNLYLICSPLSMVFTLGDFVIIKIMTGGAPGDSSHVLATLAYRYTFQTGRLDWGIGTFVTALPITPLFIFILIRWVK
jgi:ABC-type molybdate transport system permease subunit